MRPKKFVLVRGGMSSVESLSCSVRSCSSLSCVPQFRSTANGPCDDVWHVWLTAELCIGYPECVVMRKLTGQPLWAFVALIYEFPGGVSELWVDSGNELLSNAGRLLDQSMAVNRRTGIWPACLSSVLVLKVVAPSINTRYATHNCMHDYSTGRFGSRLSAHLAIVKTW